MASRVTVIGSSGAGSVNLTPIIARIEALEDFIANLPSQTFNDFGGVGGSANRGLVPTPGTSEPPTGVAQHLLTESGEWGYPLRGLIGVVTSGEQSDPAADVVALQAGLHAGNVSAGLITAKDVLVYGYLKLSGVLSCSEDELSVAGLV